MSVLLPLSSQFSSFSAVTRSQTEIAQALVALFCLEALVGSGHFTVEWGVAYIPSSGLAALDIEHWTIHPLNRTRTIL